MRPLNIFVFLVFSIVLLLVSGCMTQPAAMFTEGGPTKCNIFGVGKHCGGLEERGSSTFYVEENSSIRMSMLAARFPNLPEEPSGRGQIVRETRIGGSKGKSQSKKSELFVKNSIGNREILIFANIYKNGDFTGTAVITDLAEHQSVGELVAITNPDFLKTTAFGDDLSYMRVEFRAYEVDAIALAKAARRWNKDQNNQYSSRVQLGNGFSFGVGMIVKDAANLATGLTRLPLEALVSQINADLLFRHSVYVVRTDSKLLSDETDDGDSHFALVANAPAMIPGREDSFGFLERESSEQHLGINIRDLTGQVILTDKVILEQLPWMFFQLNVTKEKKES